MKITKNKLKQMIKEELSRALNEMQDSPEEIVNNLEDYFKEIRKGIELDVKKRGSWSGDDRKQELSAIDILLQPKNLQAIASGQEVSLGEWHMLLNSWANGGIYNPGIQKMPGWKIFDDYRNSIGGQTQVKAAVAKYREY